MYGVIAPPGDARGELRARGDRPRRRDLRVSTRAARCTRTAGRACRAAQSAGARSRLVPRRRAAGPLVTVQPRPLAPPALAALTLGAIGVVYGDIGTSPLYALQGVLRRRPRCRRRRSNVLGVLSLIFWTLMLVVSLKYVVADHARRQQRRGRHHRAAGAGLAGGARPAARCAGALLVVGIFGAALFYGDGVITPAISVLGGGRGPGGGGAGAAALRRAGHAGDPDRRCSRCSATAPARVGRLFGPVMCVWFVVHRRARRCRSIVAQPGGAGGARSRTTRCASSLHAPAGRLRRARRGRARASPAPRRSTPTWATSASGRSASPGSRW